MHIHFEFFHLRYIKALSSISFLDLLQQFGSVYFALTPRLNGPLWIGLSFLLRPSFSCVFMYRILHPFLFLWVQVCLCMKEMKTEGWWQVQLIVKTKQHSVDVQIRAKAHFLPFLSPLALSLMDLKEMFLPFKPALIFLPTANTLFLSFSHVSLFSCHFHLFPCSFFSCSSFFSKWSTLLFCWASTSLLNASKWIPILCPNTHPIIPALCLFPLLP